jgi:hypothetical protein
VLTIYLDTGKDSNRIPAEEQLIMIVLHKVNLQATKEDERRGRRMNVKSFRPPLP